MVVSSYPLFRILGLDHVAKLLTTSAQLIEPRLHLHGVFINILLLCKARIPVQETTNVKLLGETYIHIPALLTFGHLIILHISNKTLHKSPN
jgi:hypothetical protein